MSATPPKPPPTMSAAPPKPPGTLSAEPYVFRDPITGEARVFIKGGKLDDKTAYWIFTQVLGLLGKPIKLFLQPTPAY
jgi:hypothetical protein